MYYIEIIETNSGVKHSCKQKTMQELNDWAIIVEKWLNETKKPYTKGEVQDLTNDPLILEKEIRRKREAEYPSINLVVEALIEAVAENRPQKLNEIQALREAIKNKYPKGIK